MIDVNKVIVSSVRTGKVLFGAKTAIKNAKTGRAKLAIIAANCPKNVRSDIEYYCKLSEIPVIVYEGTSAELGKVCGKPFRVSAMTMRDLVDSSTLEIEEKKEG